MYKDLHNNVRALRCVSPVAIGTTGTGKTGEPIDRLGYHAVEFVVDYGTVTATNAVFTVTVLESDTATAASFTSAADVDLIGTEALAGLAAAATRTSGTTKNVTKRVGYKGGKRWCKAKVVSTVTAGTPIAVTALLWNPRAAPTTNP